MSRRTCLIAAAMVLAGCRRDAASTGDLADEIDQLVAAEFANDRVGSLTFGTITPSSGLRAKSYGSADSAAGRAATPDTVYRIGSITKQFTAVMLLQLVERGTVHLSDPVEKYLPEFGAIQGRWASAPPVTLIQLATHTAGLAAEPDDSDAYTAGPVGDWENILARALPHTKYVAEPGTRYSYSNIGYASLGAALARAAGQPYTQYVQEHIFRPLGMTHTAFEVTDAIRPYVAVGSSVELGGADPVAQREHDGRGYRVPNGAAYTTVGDLAAFIHFELGKGPEAVLSHQQIKDSYERLIVASPNLTGGYGVGFEVFRRGDLQGFGHSGRVAGYEAAAYFERSTGAAVILLRSATGGSFRGTRLCVSVLQKLVAAEPAAGH